MHEVDVIGVDDMEQPAEHSQIPVAIAIEMGAVQARGEDLGLQPAVSE